MRILRSIRSVNPEDGGPIEGIKQVSRVHQEAGHTVHIVSLDSPDDPGVANCPLKVHALGPVRGKFGYSPGLVPWLQQHAPHYDAVIVNGIWQYNSLGVYRALHHGPTPYYVFPHGMLDPWFKRAYPLKHLKKWLYWPWAEYQVLRNAKAVCFTCEEERRLARKSFWLYRCNERVVAYGTAPPAGNLESQKRLFHERFPETQGKRLVLFLGRIHPKKGCDLLIQAFQNVLASLRTGAAVSETLHLVIAGPDQAGWSADLKRLTTSLCINHRVTWTGMLAGDLKFGALHAAEAFVLPSHQENFGIAAAEALSCGLPVLISNKVNIWREVEEDRAGLVDSDDLAGTDRLLQRWLSLNASEQNAYRAHARRCFAERFEITRAANSLLDVLTPALRNAAVLGRELSGRPRPAFRI
jgi:glycosyltransferase involved in cell wall biosynthesis